MRPFVIGLVLGVVVLAGGFVVPTLLPRATAPKTLDALEAAELARRQLLAHDASLPLAGARSDVGQLKEADFEKLVDQSRDQFEALGKEYGARAREAANSDREHGMPASGLRPFAASASAVKSSVGSFETLLRENQKHLADAARNSRAATQADRNALGVEQVAGAVKLTEAGGLLAEARQLRAQLTTKQAEALRVADAWSDTQTARDHNAGLDLAGVRAGLSDDLEEIEADLTAAQAEVDELSSTVAETERTLAAVRAEIEAARAERLTMEEMGFTVGDDASFEAYRDKYIALGQRLRDLQEQEQLLDLGGIQGGTVTGDDLLEGPIEGGEVVIGLNELRRRLAIAEGKLERYAQARQSLKDQIDMVETVGNQAQSREEQYAARLDTLATDLAEVREEMAALTAQAFEKEEAALRAAREAVTAFKGAGRAADQWTNEARTLQRTKDTQRANERLRLISEDKLTAQFATSSEAQANTLVGRILTERALGLAAQLDTLRRMSTLTGTEPDTAELEEQFNTARDEATSVLGEARTAYERLAQAKTESSWIYQASLATVYHLLWQIDQFNAEQHRSNFIDELGQVVRNREQSPELQQEVVLYDAVKEGAQPGRPDQGTEPGDQSDEESTDEGD